MNKLFSFLKSVLPPKISYRLRIFKALMVDGDLRRLKDLARDVGGKYLVAIDVGANAGLYAAILSRYFGRVICIEPNPTCVAYLRKVLPTNCLLVDVAVSDRSGAVDLVVPIFDGALETTWGTISKTNPIVADSARVERISVPVRRIDDIVKDLRSKLGGRIALLKIDVEGHEFEALQGAADLLRHERPIVIAEIEARHGAPVDKIFELLAAYNYTAETIGGRRLSPSAGLSAQGPEDGTVNFLFHPA